MTEFAPKSAEIARNPPRFAELALSLAKLVPNWPTSPTSAELGANWPMNLRFHWSNLSRWVPTEFSTCQNFSRRRPEARKCESDPADNIPLHLPTLCLWTRAPANSPKPRDHGVILKQPCGPLLEAALRRTLTWDPTNTVGSQNERRDAPGPGPPTHATHAPMPWRPRSAAGAARSTTPAGASPGAPARAPRTRRRGAARGPSATSPRSW